MKYFTFESTFCFLIRLWNEKLTGNCESYANQNLIHVSWCMIFFNLKSKMTSACIPKEQTKNHTTYKRKYQKRTEFKIIVEQQNLQSL